MRILCTTFGSSGDVFPMLGLGAELQRRGNEVIFATNDHFEGMVREQGLLFESLGTEEQFQAIVHDPGLWHPRRSFEILFRNLKTVLHRQYELFAKHAEAGPIVGIANCLSHGAFVARDKLKVPVITLHVQPAVLWSDIEPPKLPGMFGPRWLRRGLFRIAERYFADPVVCPWLNAWRSELGLPPIRQITRWWNSPSGVLCMFPEWYCSLQADCPKPISQTDFPLWNHRSNQRMSDDVATFLSNGSAPIVFTPGSANMHGREFFEAAVQACGLLNRRAVLLTDFPEQVPSNLPKSVAHFRYVPLDLLLPHASAFVHHGGIGSSSQAMLAGIPQVLMPLAHDQFDNAERIQKLGIGDTIPVRCFTGPQVAKILKRLLESAEVSESCRNIASRMIARDGLRLSADAFERLCASALR